MKRFVAEAAILALAVALAAWAYFADPVWLEVHHEPLACIRSTRELRDLRLLRIFVAIVALSLAVARPEVGRRAERITMTLGDIGRISVAVVLALATSEVILRKPWSPPPPPPPECKVCMPSIWDPKFLWVLKPSTVHRWISPKGREVVYYTDAEGNRVAEPMLVHDHDKPTILVGGESIALGIAVSYEDTFAAILESRLGVQVVDIAVYGYGMDQAFMRERDVAASYSHLLAIVTTFVPEEVERPEREERPSLHVTGAGSLELLPPTPVRIRESALRKLWWATYHDDEPFRTMEAIARATVDLAKSRGARALFVTTNFMAPCLPTVGSSPALFEKLFDAQEIPRVHVDLEEAERAEGDFHPGPVSHMKIADAVEHALRAQHVF